jgi:hypothetical protein
MDRIDTLPDDFMDEKPLVASDEERLGAAELAFRLVEQEQRIQALEKQLKTAKEEKRRLEEVDLPEAMVRIRQLKMTLDTGHEVEVVKQLLSWGVPKTPIDRGEEANDWFVESGHGDLLKNIIIVSVPAGDAALADKVVQNIRSGPGANVIELERKCTVHHQTLGRFIREERAAGRGNALPQELLGIYVRDVAKVKPPKRDNTPF